MSFINLFKQLLSISVILFSQEFPAVDCLYISLFSSSQAVSAWHKGKWPEAQVNSLVSYASDASKPSRIYVLGLTAYWIVPAALASILFCQSPLKASDTGPFASLPISYKVLHSPRFII